MPGLVAVFGNNDKTAELDPLIEKVKFRGTCREIDLPKENGSMVVLSSCLYGDKSNLLAALDGYMVFSKEGGMVLHGDKGEVSFLSHLEKEGPSCLENIEGEFTLACFGKNGNYLIARDPLGIKPLYYVEKEGTLYVAPEIKALVNLNSPIKEAPPGSYYEKGSKDWVRYYHLPKVKIKDDLSLDQAEEKICHLLSLAVEERISGADNLGVYLSGGLDSSIVAALAAEKLSDQVSTYTVGVKGSRDIEYASVVSDLIGSNPHIYTYDLDDMLKVLPSVIYHLESFDCAYVRSAIPNYIAARHAAADGRKIMLTGEGSDEIFAGYSYLKMLNSEQEIIKEIDSFLKNLSRTGLQRVDRMNAAHGLDCRVPFLKPALLELVQQLPLDWKLHNHNNDQIDKWILRRAFQSILGNKIAWREKEQFDQGSGSSDMLTAVAEESISDTDYLAETEEAPVPVRNKEELYYYRIFRKYYPESVLPLVGRWTKTS